MTTRAVAIKAPVSRLGLRVFLLMAAVVSVILGGALYVIRRVATPAADASVTSALNAAGVAIEDALQARSQTLRQKATVLAQVPDYRSRAVEGIRRRDIPNLLDQADEFRTQLNAEWVLITDPEGILLAWTLRPDRTGLNLAGGALVGMALDNAEPTEGIWIEPTDSGNVLYQAVGIPLAESNASPAGVLIAALRVDSALAASLKRNTNSDVVFFVRDTSGVPRLAASTVPAGLSDSLLAALPGVEQDSDTVSARSLIRVGDDWIGFRGLLRTAAGTAVGGYIGLRSRAIEMAPYQRVSRALTFAFPIGLLLALLASIFVANQITRPVLELVRLTRKVGDGDYEVPPPRASRDEIGELARAFGRMIEDLREKDRLVSILGGTSLGTGNDVTRLPGTPAGPLPVAIGTVLAGRYELLEVLGSGGMGLVYRARDRELGETVALKTLHPNLSGISPDVLERFKREIRAARRITHRNVVRTHDLGEERGIYFITMEYVEGTSLDQLIRKRGKLPVDAVLAIGKQLCRALAAAHEAGVIHRDIKPPNMVVQPDGVLKVMDFGIARVSADTPPGAASLTQTGAVVGTPSYMAPEQLMGGELDSRTDIYAAGAVLFESLTGRTVFLGGMMARMSGALNDAIPNLRELNPEVPELLDQAVRTCLEKDKARRWQTAEALHEALENVAAS